MTPKEKAEVLMDKMWKSTPTIHQDEAKQCVLIAIDQLIAENQSVISMLRVHGNGRSRLPVQIRLTELEEVKEEIEKL